MPNVCPKIVIEESGCRGCDLCVQVCPTKVFSMDEATHKVKVSKEKDCIGCTSCVYICPSRCIEVSEHIVQKPFYRIEENVSLVERFLQRKPMMQEITEADYDKAMRDASVRLNAVTEATVATMGRGQKAAGRKAGQLMAEHLPEMYEASSIEEALKRIQARFANSFDFTPEISEGGKVIDLCFSHCVLSKCVIEEGGQVGNAVLCVLFHEYWGGLLGAFSNEKYAVSTKEAGSRCVVRLEAR